MSGVVFFKQKTAYEMRISDWSSDVCSSDLQSGRDKARGYEAPHAETFPQYKGGNQRGEENACLSQGRDHAHWRDSQSPDNDPISAYLHCASSDPNRHVGLRNTPHLAFFPQKGDEKRQHSIADDRKSTRLNSRH